MKLKLNIILTLSFLINISVFASCPLKRSDNFLTSEKLCAHAQASIEKEEKEIIDYGQRGHLFVIEEESFLDMINRKLMIAQKNGAIKKWQEESIERARNSIKNPIPISGISSTKEAREFYYDPTYIQKEEIKDNEGNIIVKAGTFVNPLEYLSWGEDFIFIDGSDKKQVLWALAREGRIILINGSPIELKKEHNKDFYFDQRGSLVDKFGIRQVPAIVSQEGVKLKINEIRL